MHITDSPPRAAHLSHIPNTYQVHICMGIYTSLCTLSCMYRICSRGASSSSSSWWNRSKTAKTTTTRCGSGRTLGRCLLCCSCTDKFLGKKDLVAIRECIYAICISLVQFFPDCVVCLSWETTILQSTQDRHRHKVCVFIFSLIPNGYQTLWWCQCHTHTHHTVYSSCVDIDLSYYILYYLFYFICYCFFIIINWRCIKKNRTKGFNMS